MGFEDIDNLLQDPEMQYDKMKELFIKKCDEGTFENLAIALNNYLDKTEEFGNVYPDCDRNITEENIGVIRYLMWSMPKELRKKLLEIEDADNESSEDLLRSMDYIIFEHEKPYYVAKALAAENSNEKSELWRSRNVAHAAEISQQREELWTSRNFVYNLMYSEKDVCESVGIFRSKVNWKV